MIIIGYQGIGKSTLSKEQNGFIDLESGNFFVDGSRDEKWYIPYCNIAACLSGQGYHVFVSSHEVVRNQLSTSNQKVIIVCPSISLREKWIERLQKRYDDTGLDKDKRALMFAADRYTDSIQELMADKRYEKVIIESMNYSLKHLLLGYYNCSGGENE